MKYQYYFRSPKCTTENIHDPECICWHDEGQRPWHLATFKDNKNLRWRQVDGKPTIEQAIKTLEKRLQQLKDEYRHAYRQPSHDHKIIEGKCDMTSDILAFLRGEREEI